MNEEKALVDTPLGFVGVTWKDGVLRSLDLEPDAGVARTDQVPVSVAQQLDAYFRDGLTRFDLPVAVNGTPFQKRVWNALSHIPPGETVTYGELARQLETSARAVGGACRANPCPIVVPCHRVVAAKGLGGFAGDTTGRKLQVKRWLLRHEGAKLSAPASSY